MTEQFLTIEQAAARLQVHPITVRRHLKSGILRGKKQGKLWRVPESALTESGTSTGESIESAFEHALALVAQLEEEMKDQPRRVLGVDDIVTEMRQMREAKTP